jgi:uncharacterized protein with HEPN domain
MARMRDKIAYAYFGINYQIVWKVIQERLPEIRSILGKISEDLEGQKEGPLGRKA